MTHYKIKTAATSMHEALKKAISIVLDIDYNEISGGWRSRNKVDGTMSLEMFFYDNLSSGAGYSSLIGSILDDVLDSARSFLSECECSRSCKNCLDNYWNQRNHQLFDRQLGLQLLDYAQYGQMPDEYNSFEQKIYLAPLLKLISEDSGSPETKPKVAFEVIPALRKKPNNTKGNLYLNPYDLSDWLPNAFLSYRELTGGGGE